MLVLATGMFVLVVNERHSSRRYLSLAHSTKVVTVKLYDVFRMLWSVLCLNIPQDLAD